MNADTLSQIAKNNLALVDIETRIEAIIVAGGIKQGAVANPNVIV